MQLLLGCGNRRDKLLYSAGAEEWVDLVTVDVSAAARPDVLWDISDVPLPFANDSVSEIHAYNVLEHVGKQGDYKFFFNQFSDFWRILRNGGMVYAQVPDYRDMWALGDPGHTRIINDGTIAFLSQKMYAGGVGQTAMTDYREIYHADFDIVKCWYDYGSFLFCLKAVK